jgi:hypothetical protein
MYPKRTYALAEITTGQGTINAVSFKQGKIQISLTAAEDLTLRVAHPYHAHWRATALPQGQDLRLAPADIDELLSIVVPAGTTAVEIVQKTSPTQRWGKILGVAAVVLVGTVLGIRSGKLRPGRRK